MTTTKIQKWGNSLAVRIPKETTKRLGLMHGSDVMVREERGGVIHIVPVMKKRLTIDERIAAITPENLNIDRDWLDTKPIGKEILDPW